MEDYHLDRSEVYAQQCAQLTDTNCPQACRYDFNMKRSLGLLRVPTRNVLCFSGGHREDATPVPIPNTEVKSLIGEGTAGFARGRVARCRNFQGASRKTGSLFLHIREVWKFGGVEAWRFGGLEVGKG